MKLLKIIFSSIFITFVTSFGLILNNINHNNYMFYKIENQNLRQIYAYLIPILSGFPFKAYSFCITEFTKCVWNNWGKYSLLYNIIFWSASLTIIYLLVDITKNVVDKKTFKN